MTSDCIGIYQGETTQLFPKNYYLEFLEGLKEDCAIPPLWIYIGIRKETDGVSIYTFGLNDFGKLDMEIINSKENAGDMYEFMVTIADYVITNNITFHDNETVGYTANQKVPLSISKGVYVEGQSIKMKI